MLHAPAFVLKVTTCVRTVCLHVQVALNYQLAHNEEDYERAEEGRQHVNAVVGAWQEKHDVQHTQSQLPGLAEAAAGAAKGARKSSGGAGPSL